MPLLVSTKVLSKQGMYTKLLRDWRIVSIPDETAVYLDVTALFEGIKSHQFDEHELLTFEKEDQPLKVQIGNSQNAKNFQDLPLSAIVRDVVSMFGLYMKFFLLEEDEGPSCAVQQRESLPRLNAFQVSISVLKTYKFIKKINILTTYKCRS